MKPLPLQIQDPEGYLALIAAVGKIAAADWPAIAEAAGVDRSSSAKRSWERYEAQGLVTSEPLAVTPYGASVASLLRGETIAAAKGASSVQSIAYALITRSPLNPRRRFDTAALDELAESIASKGQLQPGLVRPIGGGLYEIAAGERRWRAIGRAIEKGLLPADATFDAAVRPMSDADLVEVALVENNQRRDVTPMEEAEGLDARLKYWIAAGEDENQFAEHMAKVMGKTPKFIRTRLRLVRDLSKPVRDALFEDEITLAQAEALCRWPAKSQKDALDNCKRGYHGWNTRDDILRQLTSQGLAADKALFTREEWGDAPISESEDGESGEIIYLDRARAAKLQREAAKAKAKALTESGKWAFVELVENDDYSAPLGYYEPFETCKAKDEGAGKLVWFSARSLTVEEHIVRRAKKGGGAAKSAPKTKKKKVAGAAPEPAKPLTGSTYQQAALAKTRIIREVLPGAPDAGVIAMALTTIGLLVEVTAYNYQTPNSHLTVKFGPVNLSGDERAHRMDTKDLAERVMALADFDIHKAIKDPAAAFEALRKHEKLPQIFACVVGSWTGAWPRYNAGPGEAPLTVALAGALGLEHAGQPTEDEVDAYNVGQIEAMAFDMGPAAYEAVQKSKGKAGKKVTFCLSAGRTGYIPRERRFGVEAEIRKSVDEMLAAPTRSAKPAADKAKGKAPPQRNQKPAAAGAPSTKAVAQFAEFDK